MNLNAVSTKTNGKAGDSENIAPAFKICSLATAVAVVLRFNGKSTAFVAVEFEGIYIR